MVINSIIEGYFTHLFGAILPSLESIIIKYPKSVPKISTPCSLSEIHPPKQLARPNPN